MKKVKAFIRSELLPLAIILVLVTSVRSSLADHYYVPSGSMEYSLLPGDRVIVDKTAYGIRLPYTKIDLIDRNDPMPGEVVVFDSPRNGTLLIKRVVAIAGNRVALSDGRLNVNGKTLALPAQEGIEQFAGREALLNLQDGSGPDINEITVPSGMLLVLGDHRGDSIDGRFFGFIDKKEIYGRAVGIYYRRDEGFGWRELR